MHQPVRTLKLKPRAAAQRRACAILFISSCMLMHPANAVEENPAGTLVAQGGDGPMDFRIFDSNANGIADIEVTGTVANAGIYLDITTIDAVVASGARSITVDVPSNVGWSITAANGGTVTVDGYSSINFDGIEDLNGGTSTDTFTFSSTLTGSASGGAGNDQFTINVGGTAANVNGGTGNDLLMGSATSNSIVVTSADAGSLDGTNFSGIESLGGAGGDDSFEITINANTIEIDGGAGSDTVSYSAAPGSISLAADDYVSIENLTGTGSFDDTLQGTNGDDEFAVTAANLGSVAGVAFDGFENLAGLAGNDTLTLSGGGSIASFNGGTGTDQIVGAATANSIVVTTADAGFFDGTSFTGVEGLDGAGGDDSFEITLNVNSIIVDGGAGNDTVSYSGASGPVTLAVGDFLAIENLTGTGSFDDTLQATNGDDVFTVAAANSGDVAGVVFDGFENLAGLAGDDTLTLTGSGSISSFDGDSDIDQIVGAATANSVVVTSADAGFFDGTSFTGIESLNGGGGDDSFEVTVNVNVIDIDGGAGNDTVSYSGALGPVTVAIDEYASIENLTGSGSFDDTLQGTSGGDNFAVAAANSGDVASIAFENFENIDGLGGGDVLTLIGAGSISNFNGGAGDDELIGTAASNSIVVNLTNAGSLDGTNFTGVENLDGGGDADTFEIAATLSGAVAGSGGNDLFNVYDGGSAGSYDGGTDDDTVSYANKTTSVTVSVSDFISIENLIGTAFDDTLQGTNGDDVFTTTSIDTGMVGGMSFSNFENLDGLAGNDTFNLAATLTGTAAGGSGDDSFNVGEDVSVFIDGGADQDEVIIAGTGPNGVTSINVETTTAVPLFAHIVDLTDSDSSGSPELGVALSGSTNAHVRDASSDVLLRDLTFNANRTPLDFGVADIAGTEALAVLAEDGTGRAWVEVRTVSSGTLVRDVWYTSNYSPIALAVLPDLNGNNVSELAVLLTNNADARTWVHIKDALTGALLKLIWFETGFTPLDVEAVPNVDGNPGAEVAVLLTRNSDARAWVHVRDALTGTYIRNIWFSAAHTPRDLAIIDNLDGNPGAEVAVLFVRDSDSRTWVHMKDALTGAYVKNVWFEPGFTPSQLRIVPNLDANPGDELAVLQTRDADGRAWVYLKDALSGTFIRNVWFQGNFLPQAFAVLPEMDANPGAELAVLGVKSGGQVQVEIKDAKSGAFINQVNFP